MARNLIGAILTVCALAAIAQGPLVQVDIGVAELLAGKADRQLRELGARAVAERLAVTVSAPAYCRERILAALEAGAGETSLELTYRETFVENVLVRLSASISSPTDSDPAASASQSPAATPGPPPEAPTADRSELDRAAAQLKQQARELVVTQADIPTTAELLATPSTQDARPGDASLRPHEPPATAVLPPSAPEPRPEADHGGTPEEGPETANGEIPAPAPVAADGQGSAPKDVREAALASLSRRLNDGRPIRRQLGVSRLRPRDRLFTSDGLIAVVRRSLVGLEVYLLDGELDLNDPNLRRLEPGKYEVLRRIRGTRIADLDEPVSAVDRAESGEDLATERQRMEALYNRGRGVDSSVSVAGLRGDDVLYVGNGEILVVRRERVGARRYWLEGELDLSVEELERTGNRKYRVKRPIR